MSDLHTPRPNLLEPDPEPTWETYSEPQPEAIPNSPPAPAPSSAPSPRWGNNTKLIVGLTVVALMAALLIYFRQIIGPLLLAFVLSVLVQPVAGRLSQATHISWRTSINLIFITIVILTAAGSTLAGLAILQQAESLVDYIQDFVTTLPDLVSELSGQVYTLGPFRLDFSSLDLATLAQQALDLVRPLLGEAGNLVGRLATGTASTFGWLLFILLVSYFVLSESGQLLEDMVHIEVPGYTADIQRLVREMINTWYAFLRGQTIVSLLIVIAYYVMLTILGTRLSMVIALLAGVAAFIPYVGPAITWVVVAIIAYLQGSNYFGLPPLYYAGLIVVFCLLLNQTFDNLITPRILGDTLGIHPAGVLIAAIVATDLIGFVGLVLAAPVLATIAVLARYIGRKMVDMDPWAPRPSKARRPTNRWLGIDPQRVRAAGRWLAQRLSK